MLQKLVPEDMMQPFNNAYSHGVVIPPNARTLYTSGQIGARPDGTLPADGAEQARNVWVNLLSVIRAAEMDVADIVKLTIYVVDEAVFPVFAEERRRILGDIKPPAATAIYVPRLILPEWKIEVEAIAAKVTL